MSSSGRGEWFLAVAMLNFQQYFHLQGPLVTVETADIYFGLVRFATSAFETVTLTNLSEVPAAWSLREALPYNLIDTDKVSVF